MANVAIADNVVIDVFIVHFLLGTLLTRPTTNGQRALAKNGPRRTVNFMTCTSRCECDVPVRVCASVRVYECVNVAEDALKLQFTTS